MSMTNTTVLMGQGEMRRRQEAAKRRGERFRVSDETRAARAAVQDRREALHVQRQAEAKAERETSPDALRAVLSRGTVDELAEITRMIGRLDGRRLQEIANEVLRERSRTGYVPDDEATQKPAEAPPVERASSGRRGR